MAGDTKPINHLEKMFVDPEGTEPINHLEKIIKENIGGGGGSGAVDSVNGQTGTVVLTADDIDAQNSQSIQDNLERIDDELAIRQVTINITDFPDNLTEDFLYRVDTEFEHDSKTYTVGLYQVVDDDLVKISPVELLTTTGQSTTAGMTQKAITDALASAGGVKVLTTDDYNWPVSNPDGVALWLLDAGVYINPENVNVYIPGGASIPTTTISLVGVKYRYSGFDVKDITLINRNQWLRTGKADITDGSSLGDIYEPIPQKDVENNLTSTSTTNPLSANQGKVLKDLIDSLIIKGSGAPTTSTVGTVGKLYEDTTNGDLYQCTAVSGSTYTWEEVGGGSGGVQFTDLFADGSTQQKIRIGKDSGALGTDGVGIGRGSNAGGAYSVSVGAYSNAYSGGGSSVCVGFGAESQATDIVAVGSETRCTGNYSVAIGSGASATQKGQFDISTGSSTTSGYNSTNYRLLTGVHNPVSDHDAATKGYVDNQVGNIETLMTALISGGGAQ